MRGRSNTWLFLVLLSLLAAAGAGCGSSDSDTADAVKPPAVSAVVLGKLIFFDTNLSNPPGQSCASCHDPDAGFADPHHGLPVSAGANPHLVGNRNSPACAYATYSPKFHFDAVEQTYVGGQFWDGRADDLTAQAKGPFLNPVEMGMTSKAAVIAAIKAGNYANLFANIYGATIWSDTEKAYGRVAEALAAYESSPEVNRFSSKYDHYLAGKAQLTDQEKKGLDLFNDEKKGNCAACHPSTAAGGLPPLFTDFTYDNLGVPRNPNNPFYALPVAYNPDGDKLVDLGLGGVVKDPKENGKFKVPTLRNVALTAPYMHNGLLGTLKEVVQFYSTRDVGKPGGGAWDPPEVAANVNKDELGDLKLSDEEIDAIVAFMGTLTDGWAPAP